MARSSVPASPPHRAQRLWPAVLILIFLVLGAAVVTVARFATGAAVAYGALALVVIVSLNALRGRHRDAVADAVRQRDRVREREAETARRDAQWHAYLADRSELVRTEIEFVVKKRLPAALSGAVIPPSPHSAEQLGEGVAEWFDRLLTEVAESVDDRQESQRLALVELASRVQTSAHRIQATVTGIADRYPGDADLLESTMRVDHAATQQARHAQSLKVLCGEWPGQQWQKPLALVDVVRAASGRIVAYRRVEVSGDSDVGVTPSVVEPLIHLMAELLANATEYSPPRTTVPVTVRTVQRGAVIEVDDGGLGLDEYRLAEAREIVSGRRLLEVGDVGEIPQTGFAVVGRFADRHGFHVDLGPSPYGGIRAVVLIPVDVLETLAPAGTPGGRVLPASRPEPAAVPAPATAPLPETPSPPRPAAPAPAPTSAPAPMSTPISTPMSTPPPAPAIASDPPAPATAPPPSETAAHVTPAAPAVSTPAPRTTHGLPQRRSRRDDYAPAVEAAPTAVTPPGSPEQAGAWMEQFFEGGRSAPSTDTPDPSEGQK